MPEKTPLRIGNQTAWSAPKILDPFEYAVSQGFSAFEFFPDRKETGEGWSEKDVTEETRLYIRDTATANDIRLSFHVSWQWNPFQPDADAAAEEAVQFAGDIGAAIFNIHFQKERGVVAFAEALVPLQKRLSKAGIGLSIENTPASSPDDINALFDHLRRYPGSSLPVGMCLDLGHANLCDATRNNYLRYVDLLDPGVPVIHIHMHENYGDRDSHLPLFTGPAGKDPSGIEGFMERMKKRGFSGCLILEQWPDPPALLVQARDRLSAIAGIQPRRMRKPAAEIPSGDFAGIIAKADRQRRSWREKLGWVHDLFEEGTPHLTDEQLTYLAIYLRFVGTGEVPTEEDGSHFRPSRHAGMAREIFGSLSEMTTEGNAFIIRKIYPWLPSFESPFLRAEPLTRIRDIAHRNDIPGELKREIKTTLQNKLHRNAGPEDLVTSAALLKRFTASGADYPAAFVEEFRRFHEELKEFFNARSLDEQLKAVAQAEDGPLTGLVEDFLEAKNRMDEPGAVAPLLELLTGLREAVAEKLKEKIGPEGQQLVIADIRMEEFSFVLMSRYMNLVEGNKVKPQWTDFLHSLALAVANLRLGGFAPEECRAIESELEAWGQEFDQGDRDQLLRLKATLDRSLRLSGLYTRKILDLFPQKAERLGSALGVNEQAIRVFSEADIRSHPVFQLSKLSSLLLKRVREAASLPPWDVIVPGRALGRLLLSSRLSGLTMSDGGSTIAVLEEVEGDEEIPPRVAALIVPHATPHLSHLAVRARQAGTVFAVCEEPALFRSLKEMAGKDVLFDAAGAKPEISLSGAGKQESRPAPAAGRPAIRETGLTDGASVLMLPDVTVENSGSKAYGARRLEELSRRPNAGFGTPASVVLPFGVMERALSERPELQKRYRNLIGKLGWAGREEFRGILEELAKIVRQTEVPPSILDEATVRFGEGKRLMVRSSSNCEDLEGLSGAGLYETEANVSADRLAEAVRNVWASLWTERAAANRASLGISHGQVHMAVLIQEMLLPDYSFVIHTVNPITGKKGEVYIELAAGLGETLASGEVPGTPYRMVCSPANEVHILSFASFSHSILPGAPAELIRETLDYSKVGLSVDRGLRTAAAVRLADVARSVEKALGRPQDIEGLLSGSDIRLVQSRPQQGLQPEGT